METAVKNVKAKVKKGATASPSKSSKATKDKGVSPYQSQVLNVNRQLKTENRSLGGCIKLLVGFSKEIGLDAKRIKVLRFIQKDDAAFKSFKKLVRTSKTGNYSPFYVLQALNKNLTEMTK